MMSFDDIELIINNAITNKNIDANKSLVEIGIKYPQLLSDIYINYHKAGCLDKTQYLISQFDFLDKQIVLDIAQKYCCLDIIKYAINKKYFLSDGILFRCCESLDAVKYLLSINTSKYYKNRFFLFTLKCRDNCKDDILIEKYQEVIDHLIDNGVDRTDYDKYMSRKKNRMQAVQYFHAKTMEINNNKSNPNSILNQIKFDE